MVWPISQVWSWTWSSSSPYQTQEFMSESSPWQIHAQELVGVLTCWFHGVVLPIKLPHSQTTITLPLLMLNKQGKSWIYSPTVCCHSMDLLFIVCDTEPLCSLRRLWRRFKGEGVVRGACDSSERMSWPEWRSEDRALALFPLSPWSSVSSKRLAESHLTELVSIAREQHVCCNWAIF